MQVLKEKQDRLKLLHILEALWFLGKHHLAAQRTLHLAIAMDLRQKELNVLEWILMALKELYELEWNRSDRMT